MEDDWANYLSRWICHCATLAAMHRSVATATLQQSKTCFPPRKTFSAVQMLSFLEITPSSSDKTATIAAHTLISLAAPIV